MSPPTTSSLRLPHTFINFPNLHLELRLMIWKEALPKSRIIQIIPSRKSYNIHIPFSRCVWDDKVTDLLEGEHAVDVRYFPIHLLKVNTEARRVATRYYKKHFELFLGKPIWLDLAVDILHFADDIAARAFLALKGHLTKEQISQRDEELKFVKHIMIGGAEHTLYDVSNYQMPLRAFPCAEVIDIDEKYLEEALDEDKTKEELLGPGLEAVKTTFANAEEFAEAVVNFGVRLSALLSFPDVIVLHY